MEAALAAIGQHLTVTATAAPTRQPRPPRTRSASAKRPQQGADAPAITTNTERPVPVTAPLLGYGSQKLSELFCGGCGGFGFDGPLIAAWPPVSPPMMAV